MATENIMMDAAKRGADRQELHEHIRVHSMEAARVVKEQGGENDLLQRIAGDPIFGVTLEELTRCWSPESTWAVPRSRPPTSSPRQWPRCWPATRD